MQPTGAIAQLRLNNGGGFYATTPTVSITPPAGPGGRGARAEARLVNGSVVELTLTDSGAGYSSRDKVRIKIDSPRDGAGNVLDGATAATVEAVLEQQVASIEVVDGGYGYAVDQVINVQLVPLEGQGSDAKALGVVDAKVVANLSPPPEESIISFARSNFVAGRPLGERLQGSSYS
eukprot:6725399-Prymnesium_polylepis.1